MAIGLRFERGLGLEKNVNLCASMLYHGAALETVAISLHMGHTVVLTDRITPEGILQLIDEHRVTNLYVAPTMFSRLLRLNPTTKNKYSISSLTHVTHLGISCPVEVKRQMIDWWGAILWESYGAVEGQGTMVGSIEWLKFPGSVGRPIPGSKIIILSDDGDELPPGEVGTIYMTRYTGDRFEYLGDPDKTRAAYSGEFFSVGDLGYLNDDGYLFLCGRRIDMINVAGMNVYAAEIENVLALHPYVADCAVIGVPDEITGEAILALVQPAPDWSRGDDLKLELSRFLLSHLSPQKMPRRFEIVSNLARDATGKLRKKQLQAAYVPSRKGV
jgi:long-chain acyl-CoA synthetase